MSVRESSARASSAQGSARGSTAGSERESKGSWYDSNRESAARPDRVLQLRASLQQTSWYHSQVANTVRRIVLSWWFVSLMALGLFLALFMVDIWVILGVNSNTVPNIVLTLVMCLFALECAAMCTIDAGYLLSFFFFMDIVGTVSMMFDIPWMFGLDATAVQQASATDDAASRNLMLLRALRASKVAARAGRLSRVVRFLRFLPFMGAKESEQGAGIASVISGQLANLLGSRVAALTLVLVMAIPVVDVWVFPQKDYSMRTWVERISADVAEGRTDETLLDFDLMVQFYRQFPFGPYMACLGSVQDDGFQCGPDNSQLLPSWSPQRSVPPRMASSLQVYTDTLTIAFNMHEPAQREAALTMASVFYVVVIMVFSGLALSSTVTELTVRPLERMLNTVRQIASTVLKISAEVGQDEDEQDIIDLNSSTEMNLLEKVVQKLAVVTQLRTAGALPETTEDLRNEDIGILNMMHGKDIIAERRGHGRLSSSISVALGGAAHQPRSIRLEDLGVSEDTFNSWAFNPLNLSRDQCLKLTQFTIACFHDVGSGVLQSPQEEGTLQLFIQAVESEYQPRDKVPFHNFAHAVDVTHALSRVMRLTSSHDFMSKLEQFSLLVAAVAHDVGHLGVNNGFLSETGHELALQYNDRSPLENMHCAKLYAIVANPQANIFTILTQAEHKEVRKICIEAILHTDMVLHGAMVQELQVLFEVNSEVLIARLTDLAGVTEDEVNVFTASDAKGLVRNAFLHACDVANPCKAWDVTTAWADACLDEFFAQGDQEKKLGIPVQFLNDREKLNRPNSQIGFIEFMINPLVAAVVQLWPATIQLHENLGDNLQNWRDLWVKETSPNDEEKQKVDARVAKVRTNPLHMMLQNFQS